MIKEEFFSEIVIDKQNYHYLDLKKLDPLFDNEIDKLPYTLKILLENSLRNASGDEEFNDVVNSFKEKINNPNSNAEILYYPSRVLMQDFTGVPAVVDLASMRQAVKDNGGDPANINPVSPVDLVIDHSIQVDESGSSNSYKNNTKLEFKRNQERYKFLKWGQESFSNFRVVPPETGICHQVNLEYLAPVVAKKKVDDKVFLLPDTLVGTDSHTTMVCGLGSLGWGVGGIEAEASMLGEPISLLIPDVVGFNLTGKLKEGVTATDLVLTITQQLRELGVVGKFVEFYGDALDSLSLADRATISNMSPEYGATCGFFPIDEETIKYLHLTGRSENQIEIVRQYSKKQNLWRNNHSKSKYNIHQELDLSTITPSVAGPKRPQDRVSLDNLANSFFDYAGNIDTAKEYKVSKNDFSIKNGDLVIAAITSCTNTSNPSVLIAAGLVARKALEKGLQPKPYIKTSLAPGSQVVTEYLKKSGLKDDLDRFGFNIVGYGCTTCIGNSGPLDVNIEDTIRENELKVASILSGNRNFEGRVHPLIHSNYLASPPLVVAYSILGNITDNINTTSLGNDKEGNPVYLRDIWPSNKEINEIVSKSITRDMFIEKYSEVFDGKEEWKNIDSSSSQIYQWDSNSTYVKNPPYFANLNKATNNNIENANILALFGDSITTDHISPAGVISFDSPAAKYLEDNNISAKDFNSYGSRRGNHEVMMRGTFANIRINNKMVGTKLGGHTVFIPDNEETTIFEAAENYKKSNTPLVIIAGKEYGTGSSRDWAAKGTSLLGIKAVIAESFERIHRSNLVGMGVLPLIFQEGNSRTSLKLTGFETISINLKKLSPLGKVPCTINYKNGETKQINLICRIDTEYEMNSFMQGGILQYVVKNNI